MTQPSTDSIKVWDMPTRLFHWTLAVSFLLCYLIAGLLLFRLLWGFVGTRHARFADFVRRPSAIVDYLKQDLRLAAPRHLGNNPAGGAMVIALLIALSLTVLSGMALYGTTDFAGPLAGWFRGAFAADVLEEGHEFFANLSVALVALHLGGVLFSSLLHRENLVKAMFTGMKRREIHE